MNILIGGVYGVGKSHTCQLITELVGIPAFTASQLIKHSTNTKRVTDVEHNQSLLINAVSDINKKYQNIIIDGHFCILNDKNKIERVALEVFEALKISKIILFHDDITEIEKRLKSRNDLDFTIEQIEEIQKTEIQHANHVSKNLAIPILMYDAKNQTIDEIVQFIKN